MTAGATDDLPTLPANSALVAVVLAPVVIGVMIEQFLLGVVCYRAVMYFRHHFSSDTFFCRSIVICLVIFTLFQGVLDFTIVYRRVICEYGNYEKLDLQDWIFWTEASLTAWIAFIAHIFYISRCWAVTHSLPVCMFLGVVALIALVSGIIVTMICFSLGRMSKLAGLVVPATIWFISTVICDLGIAIVLVIYFWRRESVLRCSHTMITRLRRTSIETGSLTAVGALLNMVLLACMPEKAYDMIIQYSMSHLYTLSVLYTLLGRQDLRNILYEGSGTFVSDFQSSFLAAGVVSTTSSDGRFIGDVPRLRIKTPLTTVPNDHSC